LGFWFMRGASWFGGKGRRRGKRGCWVGHSVMLALFLSSFECKVDQLKVLIMMIKRKEMDEEMR
jgi:hypothetical protein